jgi:hypothetical protein
MAYLIRHESGNTVKSNRSYIGSLIKILSIHEDQTIYASTLKCLTHSAIECFEKDLKRRGIANDPCREVHCLTLSKDLVKKRRRVYIQTHPKATSSVVIQTLMRSRRAPPSILGLLNSGCLSESCPSRQS